MAVRAQLLRLASGGDGVVALVGAATLLGSLDRYLWVLEPADVFRLQYLAVLAGAGLAALALRRLRLAGVAPRSPS